MISEEQDKKMKAERLVQLKAQHPDGQHPELRKIGWTGEIAESPVAQLEEQPIVSSRVIGKNVPMGLQTPEIKL